MPDMQESASHHVNDLATPGFTAKLINHTRQDVQIDEETQGEIYNCVLNDKLKPCGAKIFELVAMPFSTTKGEVGCEALSSNMKPATGETLS